MLRHPQNTTKFMYYLRSIIIGTLYFSYIDLKYNEHRLKKNNQKNFPRELLNKYPNIWQHNYVDSTGILVNTNTHFCVLINSHTLPDGFWCFIDQNLYCEMSKDSTYYCVKKIWQAHVPQEAQGYGTACLSSLGSSWFCALLCLWSNFSLMNLSWKQLSCLPEM